MREGSGGEKSFLSPGEKKKRRHHTGAGWSGSKLHPKKNKEPEYQENSIELKPEPAQNQLEGLTSIESDIFIKLFEAFGSDKPINLLRGPKIAGHDRLAGIDALLHFEHMGLVTRSGENIYFNEKFAKELIGKNEQPSGKPE